MNWKYLISGVIALLFVGVLGGGRSAKLVYNDVINAGSTEGAGLCMEMVSDELLTEDGQRAKCIRSFQRRLDSSVLANIDGRGRPITQFGDSIFSGTIINDTSTWVVTNLLIELTFHQADSEQIKREIVEVEGWFEPISGNQEFRSKRVKDVPDGWDSLDGCEASTEVDCWSWNIAAGFGLKL